MCGQPEGEGCDTDMEQPTADPSSPDYGWAGKGFRP